MARGPAPSMPFVLIPLGAIELIVLVTALTSLSALHPGCSSAQPSPPTLAARRIKSRKFEVATKKNNSKKKRFNWFHIQLIQWLWMWMRMQSKSGRVWPSGEIWRDIKELWPVLLSDVEVGIVSNSFKILKFDSEFDSPRLVLIKHNTFHRSPVVLSCSRGLFPLILQSS